ncbi:ArpU family phage packaging/lysis transcriptional regulator [Paenibacillus sp. 481]|uniref:ArpU family phage packaging/lysis transcriptional regulator n=1 Tax=Paenibacillus sp. 481 TaxID=2835869 RepID=UPI001E34A8FF|nr:ArpU family phage packaging/lysis transcriptional regulator [Paenibacillus sp. 481]UHA74418.1 transcriptional regulator [Paenibacillus sp. 481]
MEFELPELDSKKTQTAVEAALDKYRLFKKITFEEKEASITASYSERFHGPTNQTSDQTANVAIHNVDVPAQRRSYCERIERAVRRLHPKEKLLIEERYMKEPYVYDYVVYNQIFNPPISKGTYGKLRKNAFYQLALMLNIAVEK